MGQLVTVNRGEDDLDQTELVLDTETECGLGDLAELPDLASAPGGFNVAGAENGDHHGGFWKLGDDFVGEVVVSGESFILPDPRFPTHPTIEEGGERKMKAIDPAFLALHKRLVVDVGVADEQILLERHACHPGDCGGILPCSLMKAEI
jgi:hypothetical protein